jgi:hypothetical protein
VQLLGGPYVFGTPTSILYRSDLVRRTDCFYPNATAEADTSACYKCLHETDFGFVHQVLSYERIHGASTSTGCRRMNTYQSARLSDLIEYGPAFLTRDELERRQEEILFDYYRFLATSVFHKREPAFWGYHKGRLAELDHAFSRFKLSKAVCAKLLDLLLNPKTTFEAAVNRG